MKALVYDKDRKSLTLVHREIPQPGPGEALVQVKAAALNHRELKIINRFNQLFQANPENEAPSFIFGSDGSGVIVGLGEDSGPWKINDEVLIDSTYTCGDCEGCMGNGICQNLNCVGDQEMDGTFAEYIKVPIRNLLKKPAYLSFEESSSLSLALGTAWRCLVTKGELQKSETVLIHGIGGGVALYALQLAVKLGATVIVTSSSDEKLSEAEKIGAAKLINYKKENVVEEIHKFTNGTGVNLIIDGIGASVFKMNIEAAAKNASVINFGFTNRIVPALELKSLLQIYEKEIHFLEGGIHIHSNEIDAALRFWNEHKLRPYVSHVFRLEDFERAYEVMKNGEQFGKIVLSI